MGFKTELLDKQAHEALLHLQDTEIQLLENVKKFMQQRSKCDLEYANALSNACNQACKLTSELPWNLLPCVQVWDTIVKSTEQLSRLYRINSEAVSNNVVNRLNTLLAERKNVKKNYCEERLHLDHDKSQLKEAITKVRLDYEKTLDGFKVAKAKYEDLISKGKPGKKLDEAKEKYKKLAGKLHKLHNDYVLALSDGNIYDVCLRETLLPDVLNYQQNVLETLVAQCQEILRSYQEKSNIVRKEFVDLHNNIQNAIDGIEPAKEYEGFLEQSRGTQLLPERFSFDSILLSDYTGRLRPNKIAVDDLTVDDVKSNFSSVEERLEMLLQSILRKQEQLERQQGQVDQVSPKQFEVFQANSQMVRQRAIEMLQKDINSLQCEKLRLESQYSLYKSALDELGMAPLPLGVEIDDISDITGGSTQSDHQVYNMTESQDDSVGTMRRSKFVDSLKTKFKKSSISSPPPELPDKDFLNSSSTSDYSSGSNSGGSGEYAMTGKPLKDEEWFHGILPREEVIRLLRNNGDFLVRESVKNGSSEYVLSVYWDGPKHFMIQRSIEGQFRFEGAAYPTIQELITQQRLCGDPVTKRSSAILKNPVIKESWQLNNDNIELKDKIGKGNFGDVYHAIYLPENLDVAVKTCKATLPEEQKRQFLKEGRILKQYNHPNIVKFIGICTQRQPVMIVMELCSGGSLLNFLKKEGKEGKNLPAKALVDMCIDAAAGMAYLESRNCIHRDLAARNCLRTDKNVVKISDFGMSREEEVYRASGGLKQIPVKWTAPEAINYLQYTSLSDVWSYGILMYEIFSYGTVPYADMTNNQAREEIDKGYRMSAPPKTPSAIYELMLACWNKEPEDRPHFSEIHTELERIKKSYSCF